ncbi:MAG TPA: hypothetical protein VKN35_15965 [Xanthomonadales bacterium]|nr:hypothetical protein [Xanthomonadales bacterium]
MADFFHLQLLGCMIVVDLRGFRNEGSYMKELFLIILLIALSNSASAQQAFSSVEEQMTRKEYDAAGLDKLTPEELEALNQWIRSRSLATLDEAKPASPTGGGDGRGFENQKISDMDRSPITSRIVGAFTGWDGQTTFKLENGMIWEQADKDKFYIREVENPVVTIEPGAFKTWRLSVEGYASVCRVERIQ